MHFLIVHKEIVKAIQNQQTAFGLSLLDGQIEQLSKFYSIIQENNEFLHLVAPMEAEEFAVRHILESLAMLEHVREGERFADVGAGAGLPSIPCLIVRPDLKAVLIESKEKKANYLTMAVVELGIADRTRIVHAQFEEVRSEQFSVVSCRALDKFTQKLPRLIKWARRRTLLLFGGPALQKALEIQKAPFQRKLMPMSEQRYLFIVRPGSV